MPFLTIQPIDGDEQLAFDGTTSFVGGQVSNTRANLLTENQSAQLTNFDLDQTGQLVTRRGTNEIGSTISLGNRIQGLGFYGTTATQQHVAVTNAGFYKSTGGAWSNVSGYTAGSSTLFIEFAQLADNMYFVDGNSLMYKYNGTILSSSASFTGPNLPPSGFKYLVAHQNRLAAAGAPSAPDTVYFSDILSENWLTTSSVQVGSGTGDPITGLIPWIGGILLVFKTRSIWAVDISDPVASNWTLQLIHGSIGCAAGRTIKQVGQDVYFLSIDGVRSVQRTIQQDQQEVSVTISFPINDVIERINPNILNQSSAIFWKNRYMLSVGLDTSTTLNTTLIYHTINQSWSGTWTGWNATAFTLSSFSGVLRLNMGTSQGRVLQWRDYIPVVDEVDSDYQDYGNDIASGYTSKAFTFNEIVNPKFGSHIEIEFFRSSSLVDISVIKDGIASGDIATSVVTASSGGVTLPFFLPVTLTGSGIVRYNDDLRSFGEFREIQIMIASASQKLVIRAMELDANMNTIKLS